MTKQKFQPIHEAFTGKYEVLSPTAKKQGKIVYYTVDLDNGTCTCTHGEALSNIIDMRTKEPKVIHNGYCIHKIKAVADICKNSNTDLMWPYIKAVATRYNMYELVSAFHKELRRGDAERAYFFACLLSTHRGIKGIVRYLLNIIYEETRDHTLHEYLIDLYSGEIQLTANNMAVAIEWFCAAKKKWELPHRADIFTNEMLGYKMLMDKFGNDVAKPKEIIPATNNEALIAAIKAGFNKTDPVLFQYGLKGLFKSKAAVSHEKHKQHIFDLLRKLRSTSNTEALIALIQRKQKLTKDIGYHDLNALADLILGESYTAGNTGSLAASQRRKAKSKLKMPLNQLHPIPLYAHDNHTWYGKGLMRKFAHELRKDAVQSFIDFRLCGAYFGVAWRTFAYQQHGSIKVKWAEVKWPKGMYEIVNRMWY